MSQKNHGENKDQTAENLDEGDGASRIFKALAILRGVRHRGKGKLGLREAMCTALEQGKAFDRWWETATPVKRIQVWVESQLLITVDPEEVANLKSVHFDAPSRDRGVMQVLKADEGEEPVVLFNVPLDVVRARGFNRTIDVPNGQRLRIVIGLDASERFDMVVAFVPEESLCSLPFDQAQDGKLAKTKAAGANGEDSKPWNHLPAMTPQPRANVGLWAWAFVFFLVCVGCGSYVYNGLAQHSQGRLTIFLGDEKAPPALNRQGDVPGSPSTETPEQISGRTYHVTVRAEPLIPKPSLSIYAEEACSTSDDRVKSITRPNRRTKLVSQRPTEDPPKHQELVAAKNIRSEETEPKVLTAWDTQSETKLAALRYVRVTVDTTSPSEPTALQTLHTSFVRVLKDKSSWKIMGDDDAGAPEAVIKLRFEPDRTCLGVVLVEIRDIDGKLLWQAFVGCRALPKQDHDAMFADASARLLSKLHDKIELSQDSGATSRLNLSRFSSGTQ